MDNPSIVHHMISEAGGRGCACAACCLHVPCARMEERGMVLRLVVALVGGLCDGWERVGWWVGAAVGAWASLCQGSVVGSCRRNEGSAGSALCVRYGSGPLWHLVTAWGGNGFAPPWQSCICPACHQQLCRRACPPPASQTAPLPLLPPRPAPSARRRSLCMLVSTACALGPLFMCRHGHQLPGGCVRHACPRPPFSACPGCCQPVVAFMQTLVMGKATCIK